MALREVLEELVRSLEGGRACVYCAVVETRGSTPQKAGAAMLVLPDGSQVGTLGGGCIEAEVKQRALGVLAGQGQDGKGQASLLTFCLDDDYGWDDGLICGGRMTILADPLWRGEQADYYRRLLSVLESGDGGTEAVCLEAKAAKGELPAGARVLFDHRGQEAARAGFAGALPAVLGEHLPDLTRRPRPSTVGGVAYLPFLPRVTLLIVGGGHVGQAVAKLASECGFGVWVLDDRESYASKERFPTASRHLVGDISRELKALAGTLGPNVYALIVTRGHQHDEEALFHLAATSCGYVGMIGSKRKIKLIFEDLAARGVDPSALARVHAPLGFDIGSQTVPEIAVSIVAELIAQRNLGASEPRPRVRVRAEAAAKP